MRISLRFIAALVAVTVGLTLLFSAPANGQALRQELPEQANPYARGVKAIEQLAERLPEVAQANGLTAGTLRWMLLQDETLAVDGANGLLYFDVLAPDEEPTFADTGDLNAAAPPTSTGEFRLASNPGAAKTIFLDFDGHTSQNTTWNSQNNIAAIASPPYDTDGSPDSWSAAELDVIAKSWAVVAEDFAPWDVNVTTIDPGAEALKRSSSGDNQWGVRVVITTDTFLNCSCGGVAYIGAFDDQADEPAFVFNRSFVGVSEAISHEVGHTLQLAHDGTVGGPTYYGGHASETTPGWAPIMGASYYEPVTQWSQQEYVDADNGTSDANFGNGRDDIAIISSLTNGNGFGLKVDDHGDSASDATVISEPVSTHTGVIETRNDRDAFTFSTIGGLATITASPAAVGPNLDIALTVVDSAGQVVVAANPSSELSATVSVALDAGTYVVEVDGRGIGAPTASPATGYTDYGSIGGFSLEVLVEGIGVVDTNPPATPTGAVASTDGTNIDLTWDANTEPDFASYTVKHSAVAGGPYTELASTSNASFSDVSAAVGTHYYVVNAVDNAGNASTDSIEVFATIEGATQTTSVAGGETPVSGTISGTFGDTHFADGVVQTITEIASGGKPSRRHDLAEHRWLLPASAGNKSLHVIATAVDGGDADTGFLIEWSDTGTTWLPLAIVTEQSPVDTSFSIETPSNTVMVRVTDTDRSQGQRNADSVSIDLLALTSDGDTVTPTDPTTMLASIVTSQRGAGAGKHYGVATATVTDEHGQPVAGASVTMVFAGDFNETLSAVTDNNGVAVATTTARARKPQFSACIADVASSGLTWVSYNERC